MSASHRDAAGAARPIFLSVGKAIFGRTLVGWSPGTAARVVAEFRRDRIDFVMPGGRRIRIRFHQRLKPLSDLVINATDAPHFIAIRPNAEVVGLRSFDSRFVPEDSDHDTRYITLFIDENIDDIVDDVAALDDKYRLVMRHIDADLVPRYDPFHVRAGAYAPGKRRRPRRAPKRKRRRRDSDSESESSSDWSDVADRAATPRQRRKSEPLKRERRSPGAARTARSLSPDDSRGERGRSSSTDSEPVVAPRRTSRSASPRSRSRQTRPGHVVAHKSRKTASSTSGHRADEQRQRSRKTSPDTEQRKPRRRSRPSGTVSSRSRPRSETRDGDGDDTTDSESQVRRAGEGRRSGCRSPSSETESDRPPDVHRRPVLPERRRSSNAGLSPVPDQKRRVAFDRIAIDNFCDRTCDVPDPRRRPGHAGPATKAVERRSRDGRTGSPPIRTASSVRSGPGTDAASEPGSGTDPGNARSAVPVASDADRTLSVPSWLQAAPDHAAAEDSGAAQRRQRASPDDESVRSQSATDRSESPDSQPPPYAQRTARKSSGPPPAPTETCTPSSDDDSDSGAAKSITNPAHRSPGEREIVPDPDAASCSPRILRPGMAVYWCAPGRVLPQRRRQCGRIVEVFSHRRRIETQMCVRLDSGDFLSVNDMVKIDPRSQSPVRRLSEFTLVSD